MSAEEKYADQIDALLTEGAINENQLNDLENVLMVLSNKQGDMGPNKRTAFESAVRAAVNKYPKS